MTTPITLTFKQWPDRCRTEHLHSHPHPLQTRDWNSSYYLYQRPPHWPSSLVDADVESWTINLGIHFSLLGYSPVAVIGNGRNISFSGAGGLCQCLFSLSFKLLNSIFVQVFLSRFLSSTLGLLLSFFVFSRRPLIPRRSLECWTGRMYLLCRLSSSLVVLRQ
jgi:hypothetical protein